jgi:tetratricopeptide (TPR) repeat protein
MSRVAAIYVALAVLAAAPAARAKEGDSARPGRALFERAEASFQQGKFEEARVDYQAAYDVEPLPAFLFNIGQCYRNMGDYEHARVYFRRYTALDPHSPNRAAAERLIAEMDQLADERGPPPTEPPAMNVAPAPRLLDPVVRDTPREAPPPFYRRGWFWVGVGGVVAVAAGVALARSQADPGGTLPSIDVR